VTFMKIIGLYSRTGITYVPILQIWRHKSMIWVVT